MLRVIGYDCRRHGFNLVVNFDVLASLDGVVVCDDVTLRGYRKPAAGSRSNNLVVVYSLFLVRGLEAFWQHLVA